MKELLIVLSLLGIFSCSKSSRKISEPFPNFLTKADDWISYEGILPSGIGRDVTVELHLMPGTPGSDSYYKILETLNHSDTSFSMSTSSLGKYIVLFGSPGHNIIQIISRTLIGSIMRGKEFRRRDHVTEDLFLKSNGDHVLVLVDEDFQEVVPRYTLIRRSDLFTVEGYFTAYDDTTEYFERNVRKNWPVARLGCFEEAMAKYHLLAREKHEGIYLKALSYSVSHTDKTGKEMEMLVFKRILKMDSIATFKITIN